jgi:hypothetical protein
MPQALLPLFSPDVTIVNQYIAVQRRGDFVYWFQGNLPVFCHHFRNQNHFRLFCCQLINIGTATSAELSRALNVNHEKLSRWARLERASGEMEGSSTAEKSSGKSKKKPTY